MVLRASGEVHEVTIDHRKVSEVLGGVPTVVGGVRSLDVMAFARRDQKAKKTKHTLPEGFDKGIKGDIVLLRTDDSVRARASRCQSARACITLSIDALTHAR